MTARALSATVALRRSWALFRLRMVAGMCVSVALLTSLFAVCCGLGMVAAPWFMCELLAIQIASGTGQVALRTSSWLCAGLIQMVAVLVLSSLAFLTVLALGSDVVLGTSRTVLPLDVRLFESLGISLGAGGFALALVVHFEHAPAILIERGGGLVAALLESARLVNMSGFFRTWLTSAAAHGLQAVPAIAAAVIAASRATLASTVAWAIVLLPVMALCVALGQGMLVASYLATRGELLDPRGLSVPTPRRSAVLWCVLLGLVMVGPAMVGAALFTPSSVVPGALPAGAPVLLDLTVPEGTREDYLPDTALHLVSSARELRVIASDGGGAGKLSLPSGRITRVRAARFYAPQVAGEPVRQLSFALEITVDGTPHLTWIDEAGVRLDDSLTRRFGQLLPGYSGLLLVLCLVWTGGWMRRALPAQAALRKQFAETQTEAAARSYVRRALRAALWLAPAALLSAVMGGWATLR